MRKQPTRHKSTTDAPWDTNPYANGQHSMHLHPQLSTQLFDDCITAV